MTEIGKTAAEVTGRAVKTVPQIYLQGEYIGGYVELMKILNNESNSDDSECLKIARVNYGIFRESYRPL